MDVSIVDLAVQITAYLGAVAYGGAVMQRATDQAAEATMASAARVGRRLWLALRGRSASLEVFDAASGLRCPAALDSRRTDTAAQQWSANTDRWGPGSGRSGSRTTGSWLLVEKFRSLG